MKLYRLSSRLALVGCSGCIAALFLTVFWLYECPMFAAQMPGPPRGIVSGKVQSVSNGTLTIISDKPSYSVPQGSKVDFVLTAETMIFNPHARAGVSDIQNYRRATIQYSLNGNRKIAIHIRLYDPLQAATSQPPALSHMAEAQEHIRRGDALQNQHNFEGAIAEYRKALALDTNYVSAHNNLGNALDALGRHDEAIAEYQAALRIFPPYALAHHNLAITLRRKGDSNGAAEQERLACAFDPQTYCPSQSSQQDVCAMARHACIDVKKHNPTGEKMNWTLMYNNCIIGWYRNHGYTDARDNIRCQQW